MSSGRFLGQALTTAGFLLLLAVGVDAYAGERPPRPTGLTLVSKTETSVALTWTIPSSTNSAPVYEALADGVLVGVTSSNSFLCTGLARDHAYVFRVRGKNPDGNISDPSNALLATPQTSVSSIQPLLVRTQFQALVLNYDAHIWADGAYQRASAYYRWRDVGKLTHEFTELLRRASGGQIVWSVAERYDLDEFAPSAAPSQPVFDCTNYLALRAQGYHYPVSYDALIHDPRFGLVEKVNSGKIDAIWVFGMPDVDFWETAMAGPRPYWVNGAPIWDSALTRNVVIYGFGKEPHQGVGFMCENTCHMTENILGGISANWPRTVATRVFPTLNLNNPGRILTNKLVNDWTHFIQAEAASWDAGLVAPGDAQAGLSHFPPTALYNYDWSTLSIDFSSAGPFQVCDGDWSIVNGEYHVSAANSAKVLALDGINLNDDQGSYHPPESFSDGDVEVTIRVANDAFPSYAGLLFRLAACRPGNNQARGYYVALNPAEHRVILARLENQFISLTNAPYPVRANFAHRLRLEVRGSVMKIFLDGNLTPLISSTDATFITGGFGLSAYFTDASFDELTIVPHVPSSADKWYRYPAASAPVRDLTPLEWGGEGPAAMDGFYAWWWEHVPKNGGGHYATDIENGSTALLLNNWWPYIFDINQFTNTCPAPDIVFPPEDLDAPGSPQAAAALALGASKIGLTWNEPPDNVGVTRYEVLRNGVLLRRTPLTYLTDTRLSPQTRYTYEIRACDGSGNSSPAAHVEATTLATDMAGQLVNGGFEFSPQISNWGTEAFSPSAAQFTWEPPGSGRNGGRCISIESSTLNDAAWVQTVSGLTPGQTYWVTGWIRGQDVVREPNRNTGANICLEGTWTHAPDYLDGTFDWRQASFSFVAPASGKATIGCRLGYWSNTTQGKVWFDDITIVPPSDLSFDKVQLINESWLRLVLLSPPGHRYEIEKSNDLVTWARVQLFDASHPITEVQDTRTAGPTFFYRAVQADPP